MIYFDNAASTVPNVNALEKFREITMNVYANPSSGSTLGMQGEKILKNSAAVLAKHMGDSGGEIYFTSGGTESNNMAVLGIARAYHRRGRHIITTPIEHPAIREPFKVLEEEGFEVTVLDVDKQGRVDFTCLKNAIRQDTILVSTIFINNEIGTIQDIKKIGGIIKEANAETIFHVDGVQAFGKERIDVKGWNVDLFSASGHKFGTPKGMGFLYARKGVRIKPLLYGGGQQNGLRSGTENPAGAAALAIAAEESYANLNEKKESVREIKKYLQDTILSEIDGTFLNGAAVEKSSPFVLNIGFKDLRSPVLLNALEEKGVFVSAGSACNSRKKVQSSVLEALGLEDEDINGSIRLSFGYQNTMDEARTCVELLKAIVPVLRRFNRKR